MKKKSLGANPLLLFYTSWIALSIPIGAAKGAQPSSSAKAGERLFVQSCAACHEAHSKERLVGPGFKGYYTTSTPGARDETVRDIVAHGRGSMPAFSTLSHTEIDELVSYIRTL